MEPPKNRSHTPIVSVNDYDKIDAQYIPNTDARALSIGQSTWDRKDISLKIWRHNGKQWKGNSEEMPIIRWLNPGRYQIKDDTIKKIDDEDRRFYY